MSALRAGHDPGRWAVWARDRWPAYRPWFLREGEAARPTYLGGERALREHMPELLPLYATLVEAAGGGDLFARFMAQYNPPPFATGCAAAALGGAWPLLVRNYDYAPALWERTAWHTDWLGRRVLGNSDCLWGLLDGVNDAGLAAALAFGGRRVVGQGFGIPLVVRYLLQVCATVPEAVEVLARVPCHMAYTVTLVDAMSRHATVFLSPDRAAAVSEQRVATNHQRAVEWPEHALSTASVVRQRAVEAAIASPGASHASVVGRFLAPPVWSGRYAAGAGTLYTASFEPRSPSMTLWWPGARWRLDLGAFEEGVRDIELGAGIASPGASDVT